MIFSILYTSDGIVLENLGSRFMNEVPRSSGILWFPTYNGKYPSEMYSLLIETHVKDREEKRKLFALQ